MGNLHYTIDIEAPKEKVWQVMFDDETYREWTEAFHVGSYFEGNWEKGSKMRFVADDDEGMSGMYSQVVENRPYEYLSLEHLGEIVDGEIDTESEEAQEWIGAHENYTLSENDGVTTLTVDLDGEGFDEEISEMFEQMWPPALEKLKEIAERE
jgi:uncharacterized protein YndB with AHSA1/START domain